MKMNMTIRRLGRAGLLATGLIMVASEAAWADAIDGTWCSERDHLQMTINGPQAVLPGGRQVTGNYSRHRFMYPIPMPDAEAGRLKVLQLMGEQSMIGITTKPDGSEPSEPDHWKRCELTS
jgi:hypothetical protein